MSFKNLLTEDRRLVILRFLAEDPIVQIDIVVIQQEPFQPVDLGVAECVKVAVGKAGRTN